ncbi:MAG TPA: SDR family oxidoreductase [Chitinophagales bacterium]|nr:SDR family oxidoreductase [Chitinophagales bacterium]MCB0512479.1 SDR family oxidoreductase [Bacteroidota bacterium]MCB9074690.1 SDR family oxidoreductase [Chitinophagales bacterium]HMU97625.1 SDR family oxidoreductase [Chitinophagales bacterium]HMV01772.1 SDR family oxidoreductase [Chitinophagales bacterium]
MNNFFQNKKCLITGAASGIGKAVALQLSKLGAVLILTDIQQEQLESTANEIKANDGNIAYLEALDITNFEKVKQFGEQVIQKVGNLDIVMNIAGIAIWGAVDKMQHEEWKQVIDVNLMGPIHIIETFLPKMISEKNGGHLVNVASAAALFGLPWHGAYCASKYGLRGLSDVLRHDLKRHKIKVHLVCPGAVDTGLVSTIRISGLEITDEKFKTLKKQFQRHAVSPENAAKSILKGVKNNDYYIFTSPDIKFGNWGKDKFTFASEWIMQIANDFFQKTMKA